LFAASKSLWEQRGLRGLKYILYVDVAVRHFWSTAETRADPARRRPKLMLGPQEELSVRDRVDTALASRRDLPVGHATLHQGLDPLPELLHADEEIIEGQHNALGARHCRDFVE